MDQLCAGDAGGGRGQREPLQTCPALPCPTGVDWCVSTLHISVPDIPTLPPEPFLF